MSIEEIKLKKIYYSTNKCPYGDTYYLADRIMELVEIVNKLVTRIENLEKTINSEIS